MPSTNEQNNHPLAYQLRPKNLSEVVGQEHLTGSGKPLWQIVNGGLLYSLVLIGPPGVGKTTIAQIIAESRDARLIRLSAVNAGVKDIRDVVAVAQQALPQSTILLLDEIHRFSKTQQDQLLPHLESGLFFLIGATTENPSFQLTSALLSRVRIYRLNALTYETMMKITDVGIDFLQKDLKKTDLIITEKGKDVLIQRSGGDGRNLLNILELSAKSLADKNVIDENVITNIASENGEKYDRDGDIHYELLSALIKSIRGSDPDASVYYLSRLLDSGEDPLVVARRLIVSAAEDISLAVPGALNMAVGAYQATYFTGMPEARIPLAEAVVYLALCPKSNKTYMAYNLAQAAAQTNPNLPIPLHLKNAVTKEDRLIGAGKGYKYAHDAKNGIVKQEHLPSKLKDQRYYYPSTNGSEVGFEKRLAEIFKVKSE